MNPVIPSPSLFAAFRQAVERYGEAIAIRDETVTLSWRALEVRSRAAARAMLSLGIEEDDLFGVWAVNQWRWPVVGLAGQAGGATLIPLGTRLKAREVAEPLRRTRAKLLFCDPGQGSYNFVEAIAAEDLPDLRHIVVFDDRPDEGRVMGWGAFLATAKVDEAALELRIAGVRSESLADIIFTSGTTGVPKGVPITHAQSLIACEQQQRCVNGFVPGDVFAVIFPMGHNAGYRAGWQAALLFGATIVPIRSYDATALLELIEREHVSMIAAPPAIYQALLDRPDRAKYDLSCLRYCSTGATHIPVRLIETMQSVFGRDAVSAGYGLTEAAGSVTHTRPGTDAATIAKTTGKPLDGLDVMLVDADGAQVPPGAAGEILVRGPQVMLGYYQDEAATQAAFAADGFLRTGDIGTLDPDGNLRITDRLKDMYIVGGFNVYPAEIEHLLLGVPGVAAAAVIGIDDDRLGQVGRAYLVPKPKASLDPAAILAWCRNNMANYKVPRTVAVVEALPVNALGKVLKTELRVLAAAGA